MLERALAQFSPEIPPTETLSRALGITDPKMSRLLGIAIEHSSHLNETNAKDSSSVLRVIESLGNSMVLLAVAHSIHLWGQPSSPADASRRTASTLPPLYDRLGKVLCLASIGRFGMSVAADDDFKSLLQEYWQSKGRGQPQYSVLAEQGPEHAKTFLVRVSGYPDFEAEGAGRTLKKAEQNAAYASLSRHAPDVLKSHNRVESTSLLRTLVGQVMGAYMICRGYGEVHRLVGQNVDFRPILPPPIRLDARPVDSDRSRDLAALARRLGVEIHAVPLLDTALIHRSATSEMKCNRDNSLLAHLGALALDGISSYILTSYVLQWPSTRLRNYNIRRVVADVVRNSHVEQAFDLLNLSPLLILGPSLRTLIPALKAEAFQAILGSIMLSRRVFPPTLSEVIPKELQDWLQQAIVRAANNDAAIVHQKSVLQEYLQALNVRPQYSSRSSGPAHSQTFTATVHISLPELHRHFGVEGAGAKTKTDAEEKAAARLLEIIRTAIGSSTWDQSCWTDRNFLDVGTAILEHALNSVSRQGTVPISWRTRNLLCADAFAKGDSLRVALWAENVTILLNSCGAKRPLNGLAEFVTQLRPIPACVSELFSLALEKVKNLVNALEPERRIENLRSREEFQSLLQLAEVARITSRNRTVQTLAEAFDGLALVRTSRSVQISSPPGPTPSVTLREGALQSLLNRVVTLLESRGCTRVDLAGFWREKRVVIVICPDIEDAVDAVSISLQDGLLWSFLQHELSIVEVMAQKRSIRISLLCGNMPGSFLHGALLALHDACQLMPMNEASLVARLLHDLKNDLIAYDVALAGPHHDRTSRHKALLDGSIHLDAANATVQSLEGVRSGMVSPRIVQTSPYGFLREYVASRMSSVPNRIRIESPHNLDDTEVPIPLEFLRSMLDNLLRNAVEAMPEGGEIGLEWQLGENAGSVRIDVWDTGPGISRENVNRLLAGEALPSNKRQGSGLGLLCVQRMMKQLGGSMTLESGLGTGTRWRLSLPIESPTE